jgi:hypothetical protein
VQVSQIIAEIDNEIAKLQQARTLLSGNDAVRSLGGGKGSAPVRRKKRTLSAEGRKKIADAMKRRWMERKKQAAAKGSTAKAK